MWKIKQVAAISDCPWRDSLTVYVNNSPNPSFNKDLEI